MTTFTVSTYTSTPSTLDAGDWLVVSRFGTISANVATNGAVAGAGANAIQVDGMIANTAADGYGIRLLGGNDTVVIGATGFVRAVIGMLLGGNNCTVIVAGTVQSFGDFDGGVGIDGSNATITIEATGRISAGEGIVTGGGATFKNFGTVITTFANGAEFNAGGNTITNGGTIDAVSYGMVVNVGGAPGSNSIVNTGLVRGGSGTGIIAGTGSNALFNTGTLESLFNDGYLSGGTNAIINTGAIISRSQQQGLDLGNGIDTIVNNGLIYGNGGAANLGGNNDFFDGRLGVQVGLVNGQGGNDTIYGGAQSDMLAGEADNDTLHGMGGVDALAGGDGIDTLYGGDGADNLMGEAGTDLIYGGAGGDVIRGGLGGDLIVFNVGDNGDLIQNFNEGGTRDGFDLRGYFNATGYTGTTPRAAGIMAVLQNGADTDVYLYGAFAFRIQGVAAAAIDDTYFLFQ